MYACMYINILTYTPTYMHTYINTYTNAYIRTYIHLLSYTRLKGECSWVHVFVDLFPAVATIYMMVDIPLLISCRGCSHPLSPTNLNPESSSNPRSNHLVGPCACLGLFRMRPCVFWFRGLGPKS